MLQITLNMYICIHFTITIKHHPEWIFMLFKESKHSVFERDMRHMYY